MSLNYEKDKFEISLKRCCNLDIRECITNDFLQVRLLQRKNPLNMAGKMRSYDQSGFSLSCIAVLITA